MDRYLVIAPHTRQECVQAIKVIEAVGLGMQRRRTLRPDHCRSREQG